MLYKPVFNSLSVGEGPVIGGLDIQESGRRYSPLKEVRRGLTCYVSLEKTTFLQT